MQEQGKRLLVAVVLALGVMFAWQMIFPAEEPKQEPDPVAAGSAGSAAQPAQQPGAQPAATPEATPIKRGPEQFIELKYPNVEAKFSSYGGVLTSWHLTDKRYDRDKSKGELIACRPSKTEPVCSSIPDAGAFAINFPNSTHQIPAGAEWSPLKVSDTEVRYTFVTDKLSVEKTFKIHPASYLVHMTVQVKVVGSEAQQRLALTTFGFQEPADEGDGGQSIAARIWTSSTLAYGEEAEVVGTGVKGVIKQPRYETNIRWTGYEHPYLLVALSPKPSPGVVVDKHTYAVGADGLMRTDMLFSPASIKGDGTALVRDVFAYLGPKNRTQLVNTDAIAGFPTGFDATIDMGWFAFIGRPLQWLLLKFYAFFQNWGLAIVLLTIVVKSLTIPFTTKSMRSMKAMAVLAPQMKGLQEKYKEDKQRLQMETMALYKQYGANPLTGCLPIMLQMPIWLALYRMLSSTGELYQQPFIPGWIDDLTFSDPYYVLPIVLMVTMFLQARLTPMSTDPSQKMQMRMMQYGLPLMFGVMSFFFPAGLTLYIFTNTILSALHSIWMNKYDKKSIALTAQIKKAQEEAEQKKNQTAAGKAKDANAKSGKGGGKSEKGEKLTTDLPRAKALPQVAPDADEEDDDADDQPAAAVANKPAPRVGPPRQKRKKRSRRN